MIKKESTEKYVLPGCDELSPLETFNPRAFLSDAPEKQELKNFILALAVIFNDLKDLQWVHWHLLHSKSTELPEVSTYNGQHAGFSEHNFKLMCALFNELIQLIKKNNSLLEDPDFVNIHKNMPIASRRAWSDLVAFCKGREPTDKFMMKVLNFTRNHITYHADPEQISAGYRDFFLNQKKGMQAFISRGNSPNSTRFYFADAAIEGYLNLNFGQKKMECMSKMNELQRNIGNALRFIVEYFIYKQGISFSKYHPG